MNMPYLNETDYQELTEARYQDEQTIADLEAELKTKKRDTEHLLELGKQFIAITSERDRLAEALKSIEYINIGEVFGLQDLDGYTYSHLFCPDCGYKKEDGHWKDCAVGSALDKAKG